LTRYEYPFVAKSKKLLNQTKNFIGLLWSAFKSDAHSDGVSVNATNPEITIEITIVIANCLYISPVSPPIKATGINTAESTKTIAICYKKFNEKTATVTVRTPVRS
jgi:hypothetical protein